MTMLSAIFGLNLENPHQNSLPRTPWWAHQEPFGGRSRKPAPIKGLRFIS